MKATRGDIPTGITLFLSFIFTYALYFTFILFCHSALGHPPSTIRFASQTIVVLRGDTRHLPFIIPSYLHRLASLEKKQWIGTQESYQSGRAATGVQENHGKRGRWRYSDMPGDKDCSDFCNRDIPRRQYQRITPATKYGQLIANTSRKSSHCGSCSRKPQKGPHRQW